MVVTDSLALANFFEPGSVEAALEAETRRLNTALDNFEDAFDSALRGIISGSDADASSVTSAHASDEQDAPTSVPKRHTYNRIAPGMQNYLGVSAVLDQFVRNERFRESVRRAAKVGGGADVRTSSSSLHAINNDNDAGARRTTTERNACDSFMVDVHADNGKDCTLGDNVRTCCNADVDDLYEACIDALSMRLYDKLGT